MRVKKQVLVRVKSTQVNQEGEIEAMELVTPGTFFIKGKNFYLLYNETELTGMEGTTTSLKIEPNRVTLNRMGTTAHRTTFEEGTWSSGLYVTPYGAIEMSVWSTKVEADLSEEGGSINLKYELQLDREKISNNSLEITVET